MSKYYKKLFHVILLLSLLVMTVSAEGTSIILDNDQTTEMSGTALVMCSLAVAIFAILIIVKILLAYHGGD